MYLVTNLLGPPKSNITDTGGFFIPCIKQQEPLALASGALPDWCEQLTSKCPFLIPFETRQLYFTCTAFGASR